MLDSQAIQDIEIKTGYVFKNKAILNRAFTHSSVDTDAMDNYQSLEFLGDSILDFIVAERLMQLNPDAHEGKLTTMRASIVSKTPLAKVIEEMNVAGYLIVGKGERHDNIVEQSKIKSDIFEAIVAAIYVDSGDVNEARKFILRALDKNFKSKYTLTSAFDYKTKLNELASKNKWKVRYELNEKSGAPHMPTFAYTVFVNNEISGEGSGHKKLDAQQQAAHEALKRFE